MKVMEINKVKSPEYYTTVIAGKEYQFKTWWCKKFAEFLGYGDNGKQMCFYFQVSIEDYSAKAYKLTNIYGYTQYVAKSLVRV